MRRLVGLGVVALLVLVAGCKEAPSDSEAGSATSVVVVPDVLGLAGDEAKDQIRKLGLKTDLVDGLRDRTVMVASRWVVIAQDPEAGAEVAAGTTITVTVVKRGESTPSPSSPSSAVPSAQTAPVDVPWNEVTDGTWAWESLGYALGSPFTNRYSDYTITVTGPPTLTTRDGGETVTMTSPLNVAHTQEGRVSSTYQKPVEEDLGAYFLAGHYAPENQWNEAYGKATVTCDHHAPEIGDVTSCTVSFTAPSGEIQDSSWKIIGEFAAAWPGQVGM